MAIVEISRVRAWLASNGVGAGLSEQILTEALGAAEGWVTARVRVLPDPVPGDLAMAVFLMTARYLARRNSPDGMVGMGEFGPARIGALERDAEALLGPYRRVVFG